MGTVSVAGFPGTGPVTSIPGVCGALVDGPSRNGFGILTSGGAWPLGIGLTNCGVTSTSNYVLFLLMERD